MEVATKCTRMAIKCTEWQQNVPNGNKMYKMVTKCKKNGNKMYVSVSVVHHTNLAIIDDLNLPLVRPNTSTSRNDRLYALKMRLIGSTCCP